MRKCIVLLVMCLMFLGARASVIGEEKVLARVGEEVITTEEFLMLTPMVTTLSPQGDIEAGKKKLLEALINQLLYANEAVRLGLGESAQVKAKLRQARTNVLAQEYMAWQVTQGGSIGNEKIKEYFEAHQEEFQGKTLPEVEAEIRAKMTSEAIGTQLKRATEELRQREKFVINENLLKEVSITPPSR
jgi:hypothetical protein